MVNERCEINDRTWRQISTHIFQALVFGIARALPDDVPRPTLLHG